MDDAALLREYLHERAIDCPGCGYNLRGLTGSACPECNQELVLAVRLAEPKLAAWIAGLIAVCFGTGFNGLLLVYGAARGILDGSMQGMTSFFSAIGIAFIVFCPVLVAWVRGRRRVMRWSSHRRLVVAVGLWLLVAVDLAVFTLVVG